MGVFLSLSVQYLNVDSGYIWNSAGKVTMTCSYDLSTLDLDAAFLGRIVS